MKQQPGYPLPSGELGEDEIVCQLVYLPNRPEYWQAFLGALHYMTTWRAWERDDDQRGKDAASNWREAFELTVGCWRMTCLEQLQSDVSAILTLMEINAGCCAENITYGDQTVYNTTIIVDAGEAPTHYGETEVADWDEWKEYLCFSAHAWVDHLVAQANSLEIAMSIGGLTMALLAYVFGAVNFLLMRGDMNTSTLMLRLTNMVAGYSIALWSDASELIEDSRDSIVCSVLQGSSMAYAVENSLSSNVAWDLFFQFVDYESARAIMYEGGDGENYLESETKDDCEECGQIGEFLLYWSMDNDAGNWTIFNGASWQPAWEGHVSMPVVSNGTMYQSVQSIRFAAGLSATLPDGYIDVHSISFRYAQSGEFAGTLSVWLDGGLDEEFPHTGAPYNVYGDIITRTFNPPIHLEYPASPVFRFNSASGTSYNNRIKDVTIDFDANN